MDDYEVVVYYNTCVTHDCPPINCDYCHDSIQEVVEFLPISTLYGFKDIVIDQNGAITGYKEYFNTFVEKDEGYHVKKMCIRLKYSVIKAQIKSIIDAVSSSNKN